MVGEGCSGCSPRPPPPPVVATLMSLPLLCCPQPPHTAFPHPPKQSGSRWRSSTPDKPTSIAWRGHHCWPSAHANGPSPKNIGTLETWHSLDAHSLPDTMCCKCIVSQSTQSPFSKMRMWTLQEAEKTFQGQVHSKKDEAGLARAKTCGVSDGSALGVWKVFQSLYLLHIKYFSDD